PAGAGQVRLGNESKQWRGRGIDAGECVAGDRQVRHRIVQLRRVGRKIPGALGQRRNRGEHVVGARASAAAVVPKKKGSGSAVIGVRNVERAAYGESQRVVVVVGFFLGVAVA